MKKILMVKLVLACSILCCAGEGTWSPLNHVDLGADVVSIMKDPTRSFVYAIDRSNSEVLFIDLESKLISRVYVGELPTSIVIGDSVDKLYVANGGTGSGTSEGYQIAVVDIATQTKSHHFLTLSRPINLVMGLNNRLYYISGSWADGNIHNFASSTGIIDLQTETQIGSIAGIKSHMVVNNDRTMELVDFRYAVGHQVPIAILPANGVEFVAGVWTGQIVVGESVEEVFLRAEVDSARGGSGTFRADNTLNRFALFV